jgi:hypothetical protein
MASRRGETRRLEELDGRHNMIIIGNGGEAASIVPPTIYLPAGPG